MIAMNAENVPALQAEWERNETRLSEIHDERQALAKRNLDIARFFADLEKDGGE